MLGKNRRWFAALFLGAALAVSGPWQTQEAEAAGYIEGIEVETNSSYKIKIDAPEVPVYEVQSTFAPKTAVAERGQIYDVKVDGDGWVKLLGGDVSGYVQLSDGVILAETTQETVNEEACLRGNVVQYALQFVGGRYVWGGTDPHTGADCSGFTSYVMRQIAGVSLSHSSRAQAGEGRAVSEPKPGDLVFYSDGGAINHVAIYIGNGQIVHASTAKSGIKVSTWNYRKPAKIVDVLS